MFKNLLVLVLLTGALSGCDSLTSDWNMSYEERINQQENNFTKEMQKEPELADCTFHLVNHIAIVRCPNSTASYGYGKNNHTITIDN